MASKALDKLVTDLNKRYGPPGASKPIITSGHEIEQPIYIPSSSHAINYLLGGGWVEGRAHEIFGPEHGGKTTLIILALRDCYLYYKKTRVVAYIDIEHRFNKVYAKALLGEDVDEWFYVIQPPSAEAATDIMHELVASQEFAAIAWDSIGGAAKHEEQKSFEDRAAIMGGIAQVMSRNVRTICPMSNLFRTTLFYANQLRADMEGYHRPMTPGGHAVKHAMSVRIYLRRGKEKYTDKTPDGDVQVGFSQVFKTVKNSFAPAPREQWSDFYFVPSRYLDHIGYDTNKELMRLGILTGVFQQSSSWYYYHKDKEDEIKGNGRDAFFALVEQSGIQEQIADEVMERLQHGEPIPNALVVADRPEVDGPEINDPDV